jgi:hypothetical protein
MTGSLHWNFVRKKLVNSVDWHEIRDEEREEMVSYFPKSNQLPF